jgi:PAS domain S-box-containing protein
MGSNMNKSVPPGEGQGGAEAPGPSAQPTPGAHQVSELIRQLAKTEAALAALLKGQVDAILDPVSSTPIILREAQNALLASEGRFRAIFCQAALGIGLHDAGGRIIDGNPALQSMLGYTAEELGRRTLGDLALPEDRSVEAALFREMVVGQRDVYRIEQRCRHKGGAIIWVQLTVSAVREGNGAFRFAVSMLQDITRQRQVQEALVRSEQLAATGRMAAYLAHEINNPLQASLGCVELAREACGEGEDASQFLDIAAQELRRTARVVSRLRDLYNQAAPQARERVDLNVLLEDVLTLNLERCQLQGVELSWQGEPHVPPILLDADQMRQIFLSLLLNALEAMPDGGCLHVTTARTERPAGVRVCFEDSGPGIPEEVLPHIFEPFYSTRADGAGVGLFLSRKFVREHGGHIEAQNRPAPYHGTIVTVWLPEP